MTTFLNVWGDLKFKVNKKIKYLVFRLRGGKMSL